VGLRAFEIELAELLENLRVRKGGLPPLFFL